ncbi:hypothetical protein ACMD2_06170 [Ananas comosus]|uniref:Uncharacterized protein n=1 Tax=Ananas comosus TaxID=4615 RepID=A0A199V039_ANACO|nr:hypothetical protein ACMD2_06170 [Ananas comosus]
MNEASTICVGDDEALGLVVGRGHALVGLEPGERGLPTLGLVGDHPAHGAPEDLGGGSEVDGAVRGLGVHALAEEAEVLHLLPHEPPREAQLLAPHHHHALPVQELLRHDRRQPPQHVVPRVHHHALCAYPRPRHHPYSYFLRLELGFGEPRGGGVRRREERAG